VKGEGGHSEERIDVQWVTGTLEESLRTADVSRRKKSKHSARVERGVDSI
jgi:hypothetical protein